MINTTAPENSVLSPQHSALSESPDSVPSVPSVVNNASLSFAVPAAALADLARLPDPVRRETQLTLLLLRQVHYAKSKSAEAHSIAALYKQRRGFSAESLLRKYYAYTNSDGDWKSILDKAKCGPAFWNTDEQAGLPAAFIEFWKSLCERNQRKTAPARRELIRIWQTGKGTDPATGAAKYYKTFPGYPDWTPNPVHLVNPVEIPAGWSQANLNRHAPSKFELAVARRGRDAASAHRRKVFTTRVGLHVGQFYLFDDLEYDMLVNFPGNRIATRPLGLVALDLASACAIGLGFKPTILDLEGAKRKLKERDMLWLLIDTLCNKGYRVGRVAPRAPSDVFDGTTLIAEHGTAAIPQAIETALDTVSEGHIRVQRSGLSNEHMAGLFEGQSKGNPRFKAALESLFNLLHNEQAMLPAQTGLNRDHCPTQLAGLQRYNNQLLKLAERLPEHRRDLLKFPVMTYAQFVEVTLDIFAQINNRTDHELEGWKNNIEQEFFLQIGHDSHDSNPVNLVHPVQKFSQSQWLSLPAHQRAALKPMINATARQLSPQEVWNRSAHQLQKLPEHAIPILLGPNFGEERTVKNGYITIEDQEISPEPLRFPAALSQSSISNHQSSIINEGSKFLVYLNPHNPNRLILTDAKGRYLGGLDRQETPNRADVEAVHRQLAAAKREEAARLAPVVTRALPLAEAKRDLHRHNLSVINGQPVTPDEIQSAARLRKEVKDEGRQALDDLIAPPPSPSMRGIESEGLPPDPLLSESDLENLTTDML
jgi:hypothetical protein